MRINRGFGITDRYSAIIALLVCITMVLPSMSSLATAEWPSGGTEDWIVTGYEEYQDTTLTLDSSLYIFGTLVLEGVDLKIISHQGEEPNGIFVEDGGNLQVIGGSIEADDSSYPMKFVIRGTADLDSTRIYYVHGDSDTPESGIRVYSDDVQIRGSDLGHSSGSMIYLYRSQAVIEGNTIHDAHWGIYVDGDSLYTEPNFRVTDTDVSYSPLDPVAGDPVTLSATVHNLGGRDAAALVSFFDGDPDTGISPFYEASEMIPGAGQNDFTYEWTAVSGSHEIFIVVDRTNSVGESDEADNEASMQIDIQYPVFLYNLYMGEVLIFIEGTPIFAFRDGTYTGSSVITDVDGVALFDISSEPGEYTFRADYLGYQFWSEPVSMPATEPLYFTIAHSKVSVTVLTEYQDDFNFLEDVPVYLFTDTFSYTGVSETTGGGDATFVVPQQPYVYRADYLGQQKFSEPITSIYEESVAIVFYEGKAVITVKQGETPLEGVPVYVFTSGGSYLGISDSTDPNGLTSFNLPEGQYDLRADFEGNEYWQRNVVLTKDTETPVEINTDGALVTITVDDGAENGLEGVNVYAFTSSGTYIGKFDTTDENGQAEFRLSVGEFKFRADYLGSQFWSQPPLPVPDAVADTISIAHRTVAVTVYQNDDGTQTGIENVPVYLFKSTGSYLGKHETTDQNGQVSFNIPDGEEYKWRADLRGYQFWSDVYTVQQGVTPYVDIIHNDATIYVKTKYNGVETTRDGVNVYAFTSSGSYISMNTQTQSGGMAQFLLPNKDYKFRADHLGQQYWSDVLTLTTDQTTSIIINEGKAKVTVTSEGSAVTDAPVYVFTSGGTYLGISGTTDENGEVEFQIPAGDYKFRADFDGFQYWSVVETVTADQTTDVSISGGVASRSIMMDGGNRASSRSSFIYVVKKEDGNGVVGEGIEGANVYVFSQDRSSYLGISGTTDTTGIIQLTLDDGTYDLRTDYLGLQLWDDDVTVVDAGSEEFYVTHHDVTIQLTMTPMVVRPERLVGVPVHLFTYEDTYLSWTETTDEFGMVTFNLPETTDHFKVRYDYLGYQYFTSPFDIPYTDPQMTIQIPHEWVTVTIFREFKDELENYYQDPVPDGTPVSLFTASSTYLSESEGTISAGSVSEASFYLPQQAYMFRADHLTFQFWSGSTDQGPVSIQIKEATARVHVTQDQTDLENVPVYVFNSGGSYLSMSDYTNADGILDFRLPVQDYYFRADMNGHQYFSANPITLQWDDQQAAGIVTGVPIDVNGGDFVLTVTDGTNLIDGASVYAFTMSDSYVGISDTTGSDGIATLPLTGGTFKFRVDYMGHQFWADNSGSGYSPPGSDTFIVPHQDVTVTIVFAGNPIENVPVYVFTSTGSYLSLTKSTTDLGAVQWSLPHGTYNFKVDYEGGQYWIDDVALDDSGPVSVGFDFAPDLKIENGDIMFSPDSPMIGETTIVTIRVHNIGLSAAEDIVVRIFAEDPDTGAIPIKNDQIIPIIPRGETRLVSFSWTPTAVGGSVYYVIVDQSDDIAELDENNNAASNSIIALEDTKSPTIVRNQIEINDIGVYVNNIHNLDHFQNNTILDSNLYGMVMDNVDLSIDSNILTGNNVGIQVISSTLSIITTVFNNSWQNDLILDDNSIVSLVDTYVKRKSISIVDQHSNIESIRYLNIFVQEIDGTLADGENVVIKDIDGNIIWSGTTDSSGQIGPVEITEFTQDLSGISISSIYQILVGDIPNQNSFWISATGSRAITIFSGGDSDNDGISDIDEGSNEIISFEAEDFRSTGAIIIDEDANGLEYVDFHDLPAIGPSGREMEIGMSLQKEIDQLIIDDYIGEIPPGYYVLQIRAKAEEISGSSTIEVKVYDDVTVLSTEDYILSSDYSWYRGGSFQVDSDNLLRVKITETFMSENLVSIDRFLLARVKYADGTDTILLNRNILDPLRSDTDMDYLSDLDEAREDVFWIEAESQAGAYVVNDDPLAGNGQYVALPDSQILQITSPVIEDGNYRFGVRAKSTTFSISVVAQTGEILRGISWRPDGEEALVYGQNKIYNYNGIDLIELSPPVSAEWYDAHWSPDMDPAPNYQGKALIVGSNGNILEYTHDGTFSPYNSPMNYDLFAVEWKPDPDLNDGYDGYGMIVGINGVVLEYVPNNPTPVQLLRTGPETLNDIAWNIDGSKALIPANYGEMIQFQGTFFGKYTDSDTHVTTDLVGIDWDPTDLTKAMIVGDSGTILEFENNVFSTITENEHLNLNGIQFEGEVAIIVGDGGSIIEVHEGDLNSIPADPTVDYNDCSWKPSDNNDIFFIGNGPSGGLVAELKLPPKMVLGVTTLTDLDVPVQNDEHRLKEFFDWYLSPEFDSDDQDLRLDITASGDPISIDRVLLYRTSEPTGNVWEVTINDDVSLSQPSFIDGNIYVGDENGVIYKIDPETGSEIWSYDTQSSISGWAIGKEGAIYFGADSGYIYSLSSTSEPNAELFWSYQVLQGIGSINSPAILDNVLYVTTRFLDASDNPAGKIMALDIDDDGNLLWSYDFTDHPGIPVVANNTVFVALEPLDSPPVEQPILYAFDATPDDNRDGIVDDGDYDQGTYDDPSGSEYDILWTYSDKGAISTQPLISNGLIAVAVNNPNNPDPVDDTYTIVGIDLGNGDLFWETNDLGCTLRSSPILRDGNIIFGCNDGTVYAISEIFGSTVWSHLIEADIEMPSSPSAFGNTVFIGSGSNNNQIYALDLDDGSEKWKYPVNGRFYDEVAITPLIADIDMDGHLELIVSNYDDLITIDGAGAFYRGESVWDLARRNVRNIGSAQATSIFYPTDSLTADTDGDGLKDGQEIGPKWFFTRVEAEDFSYRSDNVGKNEEVSIILPEGLPEGITRINVLKYQFQVNMTADDKDDVSYIKLKVDIDETGRYVFSLGGGGNISFVYNVPDNPDPPLSPGAKEALEDFIEDLCLENEFLKYAVNMSVLMDPVAPGPVPIKFNMPPTPPESEERSIVYSGTNNYHLPMYGEWIESIKRHWFLEQEYELTPGTYEIYIYLNTNLFIPVFFYPEPELQQLVWISLVDINIDNLIVTKETYSQLDPDIDDDDVFDGIELDVESSAFKSDSDKDGLSDKAELLYGTSPKLQDTDFDGIRDRVELGFRKLDTDSRTIWDTATTLNTDLDPGSTTDPTIRDYDNDGLPDGVVDGWGYSLDSLEKGEDIWGYYGTFEWHNDWSPDGWEGEDLDLDGDVDVGAGTWIGLPAGTDETDPETAHTENDGIPDGFEAWFQLDPTIEDGDSDPDADGLSNLYEYRAGINPKDSDFDMDFVIDGGEIPVGTGLNPVIFRTNVPRGGLSFDNYGAIDESGSFEWIWIKGTEYGYLEKIKSATNEFRGAPDANLYRSELPTNVKYIGTLVDRSTILMKDDESEVYLWEPWALQLSTFYNDETRGDCIVYSTTESQGDAPSDSTAPINGYRFQELYLSDPRIQDTDFDGRLDYREVSGFLDPNGDWEFDDTNGDGNSNEQSDWDADNDGWSNARDLDSDSDSVHDRGESWAIVGQYDPTDSGTNSYNYDTDGDSYWDNIDPQPLDYDNDGLSGYLAFTNNMGVWDEFDDYSQEARFGANGADPEDCDSDDDWLLDGPSVSILSNDIRRSDFDLNNVYYHTENIDGITYYYYEGEITHHLSPVEEDTDGDGLYDGDELFPTSINEDGISTNYITNPIRKDTDYDGMPDGWEIEYSLDPTNPDDKNGDPDNDVSYLPEAWDDSIFVIPALTNYLEYQYNTKPNDYDSDGDDMDDAWEVFFKLDPTIDDSQGDPDGDLLTNIKEYDEGSDPQHYGTNDDGDGMPKWWEEMYGLNPYLNDAGEDPDGDGLSNINEYNNGVYTYPNDPDFDNDGMPDGYEWNYRNTQEGLNLRDPNDADKDYDGDGFAVDENGIVTGAKLTNLQEYIYNTKPFVSDTDNDGMKDGWEIWFKLNPLDDPNGPNDAGIDMDGDGLTNLEEFEADDDPDPTKSNSDGDKWTDDKELDEGTNPYISDTDGDGIYDDNDAFPLIPSQWEDSDGDGYGDNQNGIDPDLFPTDHEHADADSDGIGDNADKYDYGDLVVVIKINKIEAEDLDLGWFDTSDPYIKIKGYTTRGQLRMYTKRPILENIGDKEHEMEFYIPFNVHDRDLSYTFTMSAFDHDALGILKYNEDDLLDLNGNKEQGTKYSFGIDVDIHEEDVTVGFKVTKGISHVSYDKNAGQFGVYSVIANGGGDDNDDKDAKVWFDVYLTTDNFQAVGFDGWAMTSHPFGDGWIFKEPSESDEPSKESSGKLIKDVLGMEYVRVEFPWEDVEENEGEFKLNSNPTKPDHLPGAQILKDKDEMPYYGLKPIIVLNKLPGWVKNIYRTEEYDGYHTIVKYYPETIVELVKNYCFQVAKKFHDDIYYYQIFNEENHQSHMQFREEDRPLMIKACYEGIYEGEAVPEGEDHTKYFKTIVNVFVRGTGLAFLMVNNEWSQLEQYGDEAGEYIDIFAIDFYPGSWTWEFFYDWSCFYDKFFSILDKYDKEGAIMEMGYTTVGPTNSDENQKQFVKDSLGILLPVIYTRNVKEGKTKIVIAAWYELYDPKSGSDFGWEGYKSLFGIDNNFGMYYSHSDDVPKPDSKPAAHELSKWVWASK